MKTDNETNPGAAGCLLAIAILVGATIGMFTRQPSAGVVGGMAVGVVIAVGYWLWDRHRVGR